MRENFEIIENVPIDDLKLDIENFRYYGQLSNQVDCIEAMLSDPKAKILNLCDDIGQMGGLTPDPVVIMKDTNDDWVVKEGNRRITALKLMLNPSIINDKAIQKKLRIIAKQYDGSFTTHIDCVVCKDEDTMLEYLDRLHAGERNGSGRIQWKPEQKHYYDEYRGRRSQYALAIKAKELVTNEGGKLKEPYKISNLQRVLQNPDVKKMLQFSWDGENISTTVSPGAFMKLLTEVAKRAGDAVVGEIYKVEGKRKLVQGVLDDLNIDPNEHSTDSYVFESSKTPDKKRKPGTVPIKQSWDRVRLIPAKTTRLSLSDIPDNKRARNIVNELARKIKVSESPNAAAVLMRVFVEMSVRRYIKKNGLPSKDKLRVDFENAAEDMFRKGSLNKKQLDEMRRVSRTSEILSTETLQRFVHSFDFSPDRQVLCTLWDNIDRYISICWE